MSLVSTRGLTKRFGDFVALDRCSLEVQEGEVFGLLGPNGAGKTTLLRLLLGYLRPSAGEARVAGLDCQRQSLAVRRQVAYLPGDARLFRQMRGHQVLRFFAELRGGGPTHLERARTLARRLELDLDVRVASMSTGMRQKLALAATMAAPTRLLILDEPTANLDPTVRHSILELVKAARREGRTIIFSSHVLSEIEATCDRVAVLRAGQLVHEQRMSELVRGHRLRLQLREPLPTPPAGVEVQPPREDWTILETERPLPPLLSWLATLPLTDLRIEPLGLQSVYHRFHPAEDWQEAEPS